MIENEPYEGPERRKANLQLEEALAEVQRLHNAATSLANAVANTAHRSELVALHDEMQRDFKIKLISQAVLIAVATIIVIFFTNVKFNNNAEAVRKGHEVIACLLGKTEASRTGELAATVLVTCQQSVK